MVAHRMKIVCFCTFCNKPQTNPYSRDRRKNKIMTISEYERPIRCSMSLNYFSPWNLKIRPPQGKDDCRSTKSNRKCHRKSARISSQKRNNRLGSPPKSFSQNNNQQKRISFGNMMRMPRR